MKAVSDGQPIAVPVGPATLGRLFNVTGDPIDNKGPVETEISMRRFIADPLRLRNRARRQRSLRRV